MEELTLKGKCIYTPGGAAREYAAVGCNFYRGCPFQCKYCFNRKGMTSKVMGVDHAVLDDCFTKEKNRPKKYRDLTAKEYALVVFKRELDNHLDYFRKTGIFFSFSTDPLCQATYRLTLDATHYALDNRVPVKILTKSDMIGYLSFANAWVSTYPDDEKNKEIIDQRDCFPQEQRHLLAFGFTLTGCDDWEPYAQTNVCRIKDMRKLHEMGFKTFASIEPVIDPLSSLSMIYATLNWCDMYMIGLMSHPPKGLYDPGSGFSFKFSMFFREVYALQQKYNLKIYWKDSISKNKDFEGLWQFCYGNATESVVLPVGMDYDLFYNDITKEKRL